MFYPCENKNTHHLGCNLVDNSAVLHMENKQNVCILIRLD